MNNGYIKLHRKLLDNPVVMKSPDHLSVWMYLLLNATHKKRDQLFEGERITLKPGQLITGRKVISKTLNINESKIQRILKTFKIEQQIEQQTNPRCRLISILNWHDYQASEQVSEQQVNNKRTLYNNVKNDKNIYDHQFLEFWDVYPRKISKKKASDKYSKILAKTDHQLIMDSLNAHLKSWNGTAAEFIPHPTTWLNGERWNDVVEEKRPDYKKTKTGLFIAYCIKCGQRCFPNDYQLKGDSCCGTDWVPEKPLINNTSKQDREIIQRLHE